MRIKNTWISFRGVHSYHMGVRVAALPEIPVAEARGQAVDVPGRDGSLWLADDSFAEVSLTVVLEIGPDAEPSAVANWLSGAGPLILSTFPDHYYTARVQKGYSLVPGRYAGGRWRFEVEFTCQPFRRLVDEEPLPDFTEAAVFPGQGTVKALPEITVYGSGEISLMINGVTLLLDDVDGSITIDCEAMMAFADGANASSQVTLMGSDDDGDEWPSLLPEGGENLINWSGTVTKVVVQPRWRWR